MDLIRKYDLLFIRNLAAASFVILLLSFYPIYIYASNTQIISFLYGYVISMANVLTGFGLIELSMNKNIKRFMVILFGGMFIRIFLSAIVLVLILKYTGTDTTGLVGSFFFFYVIFTVMEMQFVHKKKTQI
jgi:hypothetical protein